MIAFAQNVYNAIRAWKVNFTSYLYQNNLVLELSYLNLVKD